MYTQSALTSIRYKCAHMHMIMYTNIHVQCVHAYVFVGKCLATKFFYRQFAGCGKGVDYHKVGQ